MNKPAPQKIHLGKTIAGKDFSMPDEFVTQCTAIIGRRGSGKTNTAVVIAEEVLALHHQTLIIDPEGVWWGLTSSQNGKDAGFPIVIFGGEHKHLPLNQDHGRVIAQTVVDHNLSCILDLSEMSEGERQRFITAFCEGLHEAKQPTAKRTPVLVIIDEADRFCPQRVFHGQERMVHAVGQIVLRSRVRGIGAVAITQRPARLNKDVLTQIEILITHQVTGPQDKAALKEWVQEHDDESLGKRFMAGLAGLQRGQGWVWSPAFLQCFEQVQVRQRTTYDSSATPGMGKRLVAPTAAAAVDLDVLRKALGDTIQEADAKDPVKLLARIRELERKLAADKPASAPAVDMAKIQKQIDDGFRRLNLKWIESLQDYRHRLAGLIGGAQFIHPQVDGLPVLVNPTFTDLDKVAPIRSNAQTTGFDSDLSKAERLILTALIQHPPECSKSKLAILTGYAHSGGGFNNALSKLKTAKRIIALGEKIRITDDGCVALGAHEPLPTGRKLIDYWLGQVGKAERGILETVVGMYPTAIDKAELATKAGNYSPNGGGFNNALSRLRTLELIDGKTDIRASDYLMGAE